MDRRRLADPVARRAGLDRAVRDRYRCWARSSPTSPRTARRASRRPARSR